MKSDELFQIWQLARLLEEVVPIIGRYLEEEVPLLLAKANMNDLSRQMDLPLEIPNESGSVDS